MSTKFEFLSPFLRIWKYRKQILDTSSQDIRQRYASSLFGIAWAVLYPFLQLSIYAALYAIIFRVRPSGLTEMGYVVLVFSGLTPLLAFGEILNSATNSLVGSKALLLNTVFPADLIPLRSAIAAHITGLMALCITLILSFSLGYGSWKVVLLVPVFWILLIMFGMGLGWIFSLISLFAKDIQHSLGLVIMTMFVLSPFAYTPEMVPQGLKVIIYLNPISYFVLVFQSLIAYGTLPDLIPVIGTVFFGVTTFLLGYKFFQKTKGAFFDYV
jgi:lipopolysaccharide transport system permease protein